jgi:poly-gamma-glutamate synthesis protein (capsule biosynthesis protein)
VERCAAVSPVRALPSEQAEPPSFVLAAGGDVNLGRACGQRLLATPDYDPLRGVGRLWADADLRFVNLESGLSEQHGETQSARHALIFTGPPAGADALLRAGIGVVSTANNHAWDYAARGLFETLANLDRVGVAHAGTGRDEDEAYRPTVLHVHGLTVALFAVTQVWNLGIFSEEEGRHHVAWADVARLRQALLGARADSDFVVLSYHGGEEYIDAPLTKTRDFISAVMRLGVDLVIGHHPHVPQGVGWDGERPIFYSLGNLVFDGREELPWTRSSFLAKVRLRRGAPAEVFACPYSIDGYEPAAMPSEAPARAAFARHLRAISASVGGTEVGAPDALGCLRLTPPKGTSAAALLTR